MLVLEDCLSSKSREVTQQVQVEVGSIIGTQAPPHWISHFCRGLEHSYWNCILGISGEICELLLLLDYSHLWTNGLIGNTCPSLIRYLDLVPNIQVTAYEPPDIRL